VRVWNLQDGARHAAWRAHRGTVNGILFLNGNRLLTVGYDGQLTLWSAAGRGIGGWSVESPATAFGAAPTAGLVATGHADGKVRLWDLEGRKRDEWMPHTGAVRALAITPDGEHIASSGADGQVLIRSPGAQPRSLPPPPTDARTLAFSRAGDALLGAGWFELYRWELPAGTFRRLPTEHFGIINSVHVLPDEHLATISRQTDSSVLILDPASGATLERIGRHDLCGTAVAASRDGRILVSASDDATVRIWRLGHPDHRGPPASDPMNALR
jgi:WD40 repeat protein